MEVVVAITIKILFTFIKSEIAIYTSKLSEKHFCCLGQVLMIF